MKKAYAIALGLALLFPIQTSAAQDTIQTVLIAQQEAIISAPISGRISQLPLQDGDIFKKGDLLVSFNCNIEKTQRDKAQAQLDISNANMHAQSKLAEFDATSELEVKIARAEQKRDRSQLNEFKARLNLCTIHAPFNGRITGRNANPHESIEAGKPLLKLASRGNLQSQLLVPSSWLSHIHTGTDLTIKIHENSKEYSAKIIRISGAVDPASQSIVLIAQLDSPHEELLPGMSGTAHFKETKRTKTPPPPEEEEEESAQ